MSPSTRTHEAYNVGIICALPLEKAAVTAMLDEEHPRLRSKDGDDNDYTFGKIGEHNVVLACLPAGMTGKSSAATVAANMLRSFSIKIGLMVGIGGGVPSKSADIRLGDVIVSQPTGMHGGVIQWDFGKMEKGGKFRHTGTLNKPPKVLLHALAGLQARHEIEDCQAQKHLAHMLATHPKMAKNYGYQGWENDWLFEAEYDHVDGEVCNGCDPGRLIQRRARDDGALLEIHYGNIASGDEVMRHGKTRDDIASREQVLCFEMEAAGLMDNFPCLVIRGVCDYADSHKNKGWQRHAAATAAAYAKELLEWINAEGVEELKPVGNKHWVVPRRASSQFQGYSHISRRLEERLIPSNDADAGSDSRVFVLSGMGGVGKSENVLQFVHKYRDRYWGIFWVDCGSTTSAQADFEHIASQCGWAIHDKTANVDEVKRHLSNCTYDVLLVLDNCDDTSVDYAIYLPSGNRVKIIITTRLPECSRYASTDASNLQDHENLEGLDPDAALALISQESEIPILEVENNQVAAKQMAKMLGFHPLAIIIGGAMIRSRICSLEEYPDMFEAQKAELLKQAPAQMTSRYGDVYTTFEVSAQALKESQDAAARHALDLLGVLSFMNRQNIREDIFTRAWKYESQVIRMLEKEVVKEGKARYDIRGLGRWHVVQSRCFINVDSITERTWTFRKARAWLNRLSLATLSRDTSSISMHPLVYEWARSRIEQQYVDQTWATTASILALSNKESTEWEPFSIHLQRHVEFCVDIGLDEGAHFDWDPMETCRLLYTFSWLLLRVTSTQSLPVIQELESLCSRIANWSQDSPQALSVQYLLGTGLKWEHRDREAAAVYEKVVRARKKTLAADHIDLLGAQHALATAYKASGQIENAVELLIYVVKACETLPEDDPHRLSAQHELAGAYRITGQIESAREILEHVVDVRKALPENDPRRLSAEHELALVYRADGQIAKAIDILQRVVELKHGLPENNQNLLTSQHELAVSYTRSGYPELAIPILEHVVKIQEALYETHPYRLSSREALMTAYAAAEFIEQSDELSETSHANNERGLSDQKESERRGSSSLDTEQKSSTRALRNRSVPETHTKRKSKKRKR